MKTIKICLIILASLAMALVAQPCLYAAEEASSMMCDEGVVNIGDKDVDVREKCGQPSTQDYEQNAWVYDFGPSEPVYTLYFKESKVVRIQEAE